MLNLRPDEEAALCVPAEGDHVAIIGENRKLLVFPLEQVPEMARGAGVILQRYRDGGPERCEGVPPGRWSDLAARREDPDGNQYRATGWASARRPGKLPPSGFPRSNRFD